MDYAGPMKVHRMTFGSWTIPAQILVAVCVVAAAPRSSPAAGAGQPAPRGAEFQVAQADTASETGDEEDEVPIPPNLLEPGLPPSPSKGSAPDTTGAAAARHDTTGVSLPAASAAPETLRYVQPGTQAEPRTPIMPGPVLGTHTAAKARPGLFGLGPAIIILGLAVVHFFVFKAVGR
jgi:hypothetical protein